MDRRLNNIAVLETLVGAFLSRQVIAQRGAELMRRQHPRARIPTGYGAQITQLEAAAEVWRNAARMVADQLAELRRGR